MQRSKFGHWIHFFSCNLVILITNYICVKIQSVCLLRFNEAFSQFWFLWLTSANWKWRMRKRLEWYVTVFNRKWLWTSFVALWAIPEDKHVINNKLYGATTFKCHRQGHDAQIVLFGRNIDDWFRCESSESFFIVRWECVTVYSYCIILFTLYSFQFSSELLNRRMSLKTI